MLSNLANAGVNSLCWKLKGKSERKTKHKSADSQWADDKHVHKTFTRPPPSVDSSIQPFVFCIS